LRYRHDVNVLAADELDLWLARPTELRDPMLLARWRSWLSPSEAARNAAFRFDVHRHEHLVTRGVVRTALSQYRDVAPEAWRFVANAYGRPELDPPCGLRFNLSNTAGLVVCVVSEGPEIGVDVEAHARAAEILEVVETVFSDIEIAELRALERADARDRAVSLWTLKEAYIKARGMGLSLPLREISMRFEKRPRMELGPGVGDDPAQWWLETRDIEGHRVAIAARAGEHAHMRVYLREIRAV
jgi:4'-phosphopantetheinyl transferase